LYEVKNARNEFDAFKMKMSDDFVKFRNSFIRLAGASYRPKVNWKMEMRRKLLIALKNNTVRKYFNYIVTFE